MIYNTYIYIKHIYVSYCYLKSHKQFELLDLRSHHFSLCVIELFFVHTLIALYRFREKQMTFYTQVRSIVKTKFQKL